MSASILTQFKQTDKLVSSSGITLYSLNPKDSIALSFEQIGNHLASNYSESRENLKAFAEHLTAFIEQQITLFPENIFWDYAAFCNYIFKESVVHKYPEKRIELHFKKVKLLLERFGKGSVINFRYMHDFLYGYDWAKWVKKNPEARNTIHPFSIEFLDYLHERGEELEQLIAQNDKKYNQIEKGVYRNPFVFSRAPKDEARLLRHLATDGLIPLNCWEFEGKLKWDLPFAELRRKRSEKLSIQRNTQQMTTP